VRTMLLAAALTLTACDSQPPKTIDEINQIVRLADEAMGVAEKIGRGASSADVHEALAAMNLALGAAQKQINEIASRVSVAKYLGRGSIDPRDVTVCIDASVTSAASIEQMSIDMLAPWLMQVVECANKSRTYFDAVSGDDAAAVALAISVIYPIKLVGEAKGGLAAEPALLEDYRSANEAIVARLAPKCRERKGAGSAGTEQVRYECAAHEVAISVQPKLDALAAQLTTSR
jgi:hypothetical protein